ncbi:MAG: PHP domain-containing protein [Gammaproteobacteria bacterium]
MYEKYDLHSHSTASDGALTPTELVQRASRHGVAVLALTDHDSVAGLAEAQQAAGSCALRLIAGIELSAQWQDKTFHILGLDIDPQNPLLRQATRNLQRVRLERARKIAAKLEKKGIGGAFEAVSRRAGDGMITRSHFADFLVANFHVGDRQEAFDRYLARGKPAYAAAEWATLADALQWIAAAGGIAAVAHPLRYKLTASWMKRFLTAFKEHGGQAMEVVAGRYNAGEIRLCAAYAQQFGLAGSVGSDFHTPENSWQELGRLAPLPEGIVPVWTLFGRD